MESQFEWNCHDEDLLMTSDLTRHTGKYSATANEYGARDKERMCEMKWNQRDTQVLRIKLNKRLLFALSGQAVRHKWNDQFNSTCYTCVSKLDATTNIQCSCCAHPDYNGEE